MRYTYIHTCTYNVQERWKADSRNRRWYRCAFYLRFVRSDDLWPSIYNVYISPVMIDRLYFDVLSAAVCCPKCLSSCRFLYIVLRLRRDSLYPSLSLVFIENYTKRTGAYSHAQYTIFFWKKPHYPEQLHPFPFIDSIFSCTTHAHIHIRIHTHAHARSSCLYVVPDTRVRAFSAVSDWRQPDRGDKERRAGGDGHNSRTRGIVCCEWVKTSQSVSHSVKRQVGYAAVAISLADSSFVYLRNKEEKKRGHLEWVQILLAIL